MRRLFDSVINYSATRTEKNGAERTFRASLIHCCILGGGFDEPISDGSTATRKRTYTIVMRRADWPDVSAPQDGDIITLESGEKLRVKALNLQIGRDWMVEARSC